MKKIRIIAIICIVALLVCGCSNRKAMSQLKNVNVLHASGTNVLDGEGNTVYLGGKRLTVAAEEMPTAEDISEVLSENYNALCLRFYGEVIGADWRLTESAEAILEEAIKQCTAAKKYLLIDVSQYPEEHSAWYTDSDFAENVASFWQYIAEKMVDEPYFGAYVISNIPRPGMSAERTSLEIFELFLQQLCDGIREVDAEHMIAIGMLTPYLSREDEYHAFPYVKDANFMYLAPLESLSFFADQIQPGMDGAAHLTYPGKYIYNITGVDTREPVVGSSISLSSITDQTRATSVFEVEEDNLMARLGVYVSSPDGSGGGELRVMSLRFVECDDEGNETKVLFDMESSENVPFDFLTDLGESGIGSVYDDGSAYLESIDDSTFFYVRDLYIPLEKGKKYQLTVTMKQRNIPLHFTCSPCVQTYESKGHDYLNAELIEKNCTELLDQAKAVGVPLTIDSAGVSDTVTEEKGRAAYLADLSATFDKLAIHSIWR
ncbi:MAG: cellulase family glycosylhydrolase [Clostridia bacterium]|nr:cellulase family glycosylhydrolase [Clostridia bacterium]